MLCRGVVGGHIDRALRGRLVDIFLARPRRRGLAAVDAERIENRLRLEDEQRRLARHHAVALRERHDARAVIALAFALELVDGERRPQARYEAVTRSRRDLELHRIALLELLSRDLAAEHDL